MTTEQFIDLEREDRNSASGWERVHFCPGSPQLIASLPPEARKQTNEAAASGQRIHKAWETNDESDLEMGEAEIKERLQALADEAYEKWRIDVLIPGLGADLANCQIKSERREERYWIFNGDLEKVASAKVDLAYVYPPFALIIDGKTGFKETTQAARNLQCKVQAVALMEEFPSVTQVRVSVAAHRFKSLLTQADYLQDDLDRAKLEILQDDWVSRQADAKRVPGAHCTYCPAKAWCVENGVYSMLPSVQALNVPVPAQIKEPLSKAEVVLYVDRLSVADLAFIERRRTMATNLFEATKKRLKSLPTEELAKLGFQLVDGRNQLEVKSFNGLIDYLYQLHDSGVLTAEEFSQCFKFTIGPLEENYLPRFLAKANEKGGPEITAKEAKADLRTELSRFISFDDPKNRTAPVLKEL